MRGKARLIVVNRTWELAPWADVLYSGDTRFWRDYDTSGFAGMRVAGTKEDQFYRVPDEGFFIEDARGWLPKCARLHLSGTQAIVYAAAWGARRIVLTGFDMAGGHWHRDHNNAERLRYEAQIAGLTLMAPEIEAMGVAVINCSRQTALTCFPRARLEDVL